MIIELLSGIIIGMVLLYILSKIYCFKNKKEWKRFRKDYIISILKKKQKKSKKIKRRQHG